MTPDGLFRIIFSCKFGLQQADKRFSTKLIDQSPESKHLVSVVKL
jgi:hypothetical protein